MSILFFIIVESIIFTICLIGAYIAPWPECKWFTLGMGCSGILLLFAVNNLIYTIQ